MTSTFLVSRHGETNHNVENRLQGQQDIPLNSRGRFQAKQSADYLLDFPITAVYATNLSRAQETAHIMAGDRGLPIQVEPDLREIGHGDWEGLRPEEIDPWQYYLWKNRPKICRKPNGESLLDFSLRVTTAWEKLVNHHQGEAAATVLVVAHRVTIQVLLCHIVGVDVEHFWDFNQENCAINMITYDNGTPILMATNIVPWKLSSSLVAA